MINALSLSVGLCAIAAAVVLFPTMEIASLLGIGTALGYTISTLVGVTGLVSMGVFASTCYNNKNSNADVYLSYKQTA